MFELKKFENGTKSIVKALSRLKKKAYVVVGGGDSAAAVNKYKLKEAFAHISTGGGASLEYLEGKILPGIEALK
jgi:3-phosphoglycerate kinase